MRDAIDQLLAIERAAGKAEYGQPLPIVNAFIDSELTRLESVVPPLHHDTDFAVLDRLFMDSVLRMDARGFPGGRIQPKAPHCSVLGYNRQVIGE